MRLSIEIMLRGNNHVFAETFVHPTEPAAWTEEDVAMLLKEILRATARAQSPETPEPSDISFRGMNWIVHPAADGVVLAVEIHSASAVAGPIALAVPALEGLITKAVAAANRPGLVH